MASPGQDSSSIWTKDLHEEMANLTGYLSASGSRLHGLKTVRLLGMDRLVQTTQFRPDFAPNCLSRQRRDDNLVIGHACNLLFFHLRRSKPHDEKFGMLEFWGNHNDVSIVDMEGTPPLLA